MESRNQRTFGEPAPPAQTASVPSTELKQLYTIVKNNLTKLAEKMPEEHYGFKAAPEIGAFGQLIAHVAETNPQLHDGEWQSQGDQSQAPKPPRPNWSPR
jgi:hypothetical protein